MANIDNLYQKISDYKQLQVFDCDVDKTIYTLTAIKMCVKVVSNAVILMSERGVIIELYTILLFLYIIHNKNRLIYILHFVTSIFTNRSYFFVDKVIIDN